MYARHHASIATPIGRVTVRGTESALISLSVDSGSDLSAPQTDLLREAIIQIEQWFAGNRRGFALPLVPLPTERGEVLRQGMIAIGYGETISYGALARRLTSSPRAVGQACARNPLPIIVPCHRILGAGDMLGAYSGGDGPVTKAWLLAHEQHHCPDPTRLL